MTADRSAIILCGLGYGDEGKGTWTDFLARSEPVHTVVRFNGGAQAGHNVVTPDGRHHTFAQFGSGTFVRGVSTHLSHFMLLNPMRLLHENDQLHGLGVTDALARLTIDRQAPVTTPFQVAANRLRELARGDARHGSCGMGIGETMADWLAFGERTVLAGDLSDAITLRRKLQFVQELKREQLRETVAALPRTEAVERERRVLDGDDAIDACIRAYTHVAGQARLVDGSFLGELLELPGAVVFEGAQGVLLDEWHGFHPYTTWSTTTFKNALTLLHEQAYDGEIVKLGLLRAYMTRHGAGPLVGESPDLRSAFRDPYNVMNDWQQGFRVGHFDAVASRYAVEVTGRPDLLAVSHLDQLAAAPASQMAVAYRYGGDAADLTGYVDAENGLVIRLRPSPTPEDLEYQARLTEIVERCEPVYRRIDGGAGGLLDAIQRQLGVAVALTSSGPSAAEKRTWKPRFSGRAGASHRHRMRTALGAPA
ncbi:MAG: adenylosuccinate synthetase [Chloroflexota bacterium]